MYIPEKMKLNRFQNVNIPANKDYFSRLGFVSPECLQYSGDDLPPDTGMTKVEQIADFEKYCEMKQREEADS